MRPDKTGGPLVVPGLRRLDSFIIKLSSAYRAEVRDPVRMPNQIKQALRVLFTTFSFTSSPRHVCK